MIIKGHNVNVDELVNKIEFDSYRLKDNGKGLLLTNYEIAILTQNGFNYQKYSNLSDLIFDVDNYLNDGYADEELENVITSISERHYYNETNK